MRFIFMSGTTIQARKKKKNLLFYPYVINYIISGHGLIELISRNFYSVIESVKSKGVVLETLIEKQGVGEPKQMDFFENIYTNNLKPTLLIGDIAFKSENRQNNIEFSIEEISKDIVDNHIYLLPFLLKSAGVLLIMAYETSPDIKYDKADPLWNFLYHCRNAVAHNGKFKIDNRGKKRLPAKWGNMEILESMNGMNLFKDGTNPGLLSPGDSLYLLYDIEQKYL